MLRPAFTQALSETLLAGKHVNLVSPHGRGRRQTLLDLEALLAGVDVRKIDLKREQDVWRTWFENTLSMNGQAIVIIHNIESLTEQQKEALSSLKVFTLLCVSERPMHDKDMISIVIPKQ